MMMMMMLMMELSGWTLTTRLHDISTGVAAAADATLTAATQCKVRVKVVVWRCLGGGRWCWGDVSQLGVVRSVQDLHVTWPDHDDDDDRQQQQAAAPLRHWSTDEQLDALHPDQLTQLASSLSTWTPLSSSSLYTTTTTSSSSSSS